MSEEELKILEKQLSHFIKWLANNRPYKEGLLYGDMKDYLFMLNELENFIATYGIERLNQKKMNEEFCYHNGKYTLDKDDKCCKCGLPLKPKEDDKGRN